MKYWAFISGLCIIVGIWLSGVLGVFRLPESLLYDYYVRLTPENTSASSNILLIEANHEQKNGGDEIWLKLLDLLEQMHPNQVLFTFVPGNVSDNFYRAAEQYANVLFGYEVTQLPERIVFALEPLPEALETHALRFGLVAVPPGYHGIHRSQYAHFLIEGQSYPSFESAAARYIQPDQSLSGNSTYLVNFLANPYGIPKISLSGALSEDIVAELVQGKQVIIGFKKSVLDPGLHTPLTPVDGMSLLEFHGHALDTLVADRRIRVLDDRMKLVVITGVVSLALLLSRFLKIRLFSGLVLPIMALYLVISWVGFSYFLLWLPIVEMLSVHLLTFVVLGWGRIVQHEQSIRKMLAQTSVRLRERTLPENFHDTEEHWLLIINMIDQILDLDRVIFLETVTGDHRVREIKALHCSLSDIQERRRDYHRPPYSTAIQGNMAIKLEEQLFLKKTGKPEEQYLVPLTFGGRVLGFWVFGIEPSKIAGIADFFTVISNFAGQISELLYRREQRRSQRLSLGKGLLRYLRLERIDADYRGLNNSITLLERRLNLLETVVDGGSTAVILYNLFGQVLHINKRMSELVQHSDFMPYNMNAADFASAVTQLPLDDVRQLLRRLLFEHKSTTLPTVLSSEPARQYMLHIRPLIHESSTTFSDNASPFHTYGILFEFLEITELAMFHQLKHELFDNLSFRFRRDFQPVVLAGSLLEGNDLSESQRTSVCAMLRQSIDNLLTSVSEAKSDLLKTGLQGTIKQYPIDPRQPLLSAVGELTGLAAKRKITFDVEAPESNRMVRTDPDGLVDIFKAILTVLITDAIENSQIQIDLVEMDQEVVYSLSNTGFGMPNKVFQQYVFDNTEATSLEFKQLRNAITQVQEKGGTIGALSKVGEGMHFTVHLSPISIKN